MAFRTVAFGIGAHTLDCWRNRLAWGR